MVYPSPLSSTEAEIRYAPPIPSTVPARLANLPFSIAPWRSMCNPDISLSTAASPLILIEEGSIEKLLSVSI